MDIIYLYFAFGGEGDAVFFELGRWNITASRQDTPIFTIVS
jgi:hypothetical protein